MEKIVSGFVSIVGRPNVGKSTFLNSVLGQKITIMSDKPQTTRNLIQGIYNDLESQIVFIDTPGIHKPHHELGRRMTEEAYKSTREVDLVLFMVSAKEALGPGDKLIIERLKKLKMPVYLIINKVDLLRNQREIDQTIVSYTKEMNFQEVFPISALEKTNLDVLLADIKKHLPEGPRYFPEDQITDHPERFIIAELIREKILMLTKEEVPHSVAVIVESMKKDEENPNLINCYATIIVERDSQKGIVIGANGELLKKVGTLARKDINSLLGMKVHLELWVKVKKDWRNKNVDLKNFGYSFDDF